MDLQHNRTTEQCLSDDTFAKKNSMYLLIKQFDDLLEPYFDAQFFENPSTHRFWGCQTHPGLQKIAWDLS